MTFSNPAGFAVALAALPIVLLHALRPRRRAHTVNWTFLWRSVTTDNPATAARPWHRPWSPLLAVQLLLVGLVAVAAAGPELRRTVPPGGRVVYVLDASASMRAVDGSPDRMADARAATKAARAALADGSVAGVVVADADPRIRLRPTADRDAFDAVVDGVQPTAGRADVGRAFALAQSLATADSTVSLVFVSDGALPDRDVAQIPAGTVHLAVGERAANRAITRLTVEPRGGSLVARATVRNTGGPATTQQVRFDVDDASAAVVDVEVGPGESVSTEAVVGPGRRVVATLLGEDLLALDDRAYAVVADQRAVRVLHAGGDDPFLDLALASIGGLAVQRVATVPDTAEDLAAFDLVIADRVDATAAVAARLPVFAVAPPSGFGPIRVTGSVADPVVATVVTTDALLTGLDLAGLEVAAAQQLDPGTAQVLVGGTSPLLLRGDVDRVPFVYLGFGLADASLPLDVAFPLLVERLVAELTAAARPVEGIEVGDPLPRPGDGPVTITLPGARVERLAPGAAAPIAREVGFHRVETTDTGGRDGAGAGDVAVNVPAEEAVVAPRALTFEAAIPAGGADSGPDRTGSAAPAAPAGESRTSLLPWVIAAALAVLAAETVASARRRGVGGGQWATAVGLRVGVAGLLVAALVDPTLRRPGRDVTTVFVLDASDSLGAGGRAEAERFVADALAQRPDGARAAVVTFGGDAVVARPAGDLRPDDLAAVDRGTDERSPEDRGLEDRGLDTAGRPEDDEVARTAVDASRTDLAAALRLAAAAAPPEGRRRLVLVSDGRATDGDEAIEIERLRRAGIPVDVHTVRPDRARDVAIDALEVPASVRTGEQVTVTAVVDADASVLGEEATVVLRRDGTEIARRTVALNEAITRVAFTDVAGPPPGPARYEARVILAGDTVGANDRADAGTRIAGPARVLLVEGTAGEGTALAEALRAGGVTVDVVGVRSFPATDQLVGYAATVLVDVDVRTLAPANVDALTTAVRDLGRGLLTVGGPRSYGTGGYLDSALEDLLPVRSEISDPARQETVAQVLAIDTSGSMGSCHCSGGVPGSLNQNRIFTNVSKTDLSRSAAARTIESLRPNDEVGLLAITGGERWVIDLQKVPPLAVVDGALRTLRPDGTTDLTRSLQTSADALRSSKAKLRHIILFTDGFTGPTNLQKLAADAAALAAEGITTSVVVTGEGADLTGLEAIAVAGSGRFYAAKDLNSIPQIITDEVMLNARQLINEGEFVPQISAASPVVAGLAATPPLLGFQATTEKPSARTLLRVGEQLDPLLVTWQVGLGRSTAWTSDAALQWSQLWQRWAGYVEFWTKVVKDVLPATEGDGVLSATVRDGQLVARVQSSVPFPDAAVATMTVVGPDGAPQVIGLERVDATTFTGSAAAPAVGVYAVGAEVSASGTTVATVATTATRSYGDEYLPGDADLARLGSVAATTGGTLDVAAAETFRADGLAPGEALRSLRLPLLVAALLAWIAAVAASRVLFDRPRRLFDAVLALGGRGRRVRLSRKARS